MIHSKYNSQGWAKKREVRDYHEEDDKAARNQQEARQEGLRGRPDILPVRGLARAAQGEVQKVRAVQAEQGVQILKEYMRGVPG